MPPAGIVDSRPRTLTLTQSTGNGEGCFRFGDTRVQARKLVKPPAGPFPAKERGESSPGAAAPGPPVGLGGGDG